MRNVKVARACPCPSHDPLVFTKCGADSQSMAVARNPSRSCQVAILFPTLIALMNDMYIGKRQRKVSMIPISYNAAMTALKTLVLDPIRMP